MKNKVFLTFIIIFVLILTIGAVSASAATYSGECGENGDNITWSLDIYTGVLNITGTGKMKGYSSEPFVPWYNYIMIINTINISNGITCIGNCSFSGCSRLTSITIPSSVTSIGNYAFENCSKITGITIPPSVTSIGVNVFAGCSGIKDVTVDSGNTVYKSSGNCIIRISDNCLICGIHTSIIPSYVTSIGAYAFDNCPELTSITIPSGVTSIGGHAFYGCSKLTSITFGENSKLTSIGAYAFNDCTGLAGIIIPDSVTSIGTYAFNGCSRLTGIKIPDRVTSIGNNAFSDCHGFTSITVENGNTVYKSDGNCLIKIEDNCLIAGCKNSVIPDYVKSIGRSAFGGCSQLISITIPLNVTSIGENAFDNCSELTSIIIPSTVISIDSYAFYNCSKLTSITISSGVTSIGRYAFYGTGYYNNTSNWENNVLYIGKHLIEAKKTLSGEYNIKSGTLGIANNAFSSCSKFTSITIPDSVTSIGDCAFNDCSKLTTIYFIGTQTKWNSIIKGLDAIPSCAKIVYTVCEHDYSETVIPPTCSVKGYTRHTCSICTYYYDDTYVDTLPHTWNNGAVTTQPTHMTKGTKTFTCTVCKSTKTEEVEKLAEHTYEIYTQYDAVQHKKSCACGDFIYENHTWDNGTVTVKPTATTTGTMKYVCTVCSAEKTEEIPVLKTVSALKNEDSVIDTDDETGYARGIKDKANTVTEVLEQFTDTSNIKIVDKDGNELTGSQKLGTGSKIQITDGDGNVVDEITVIINGDVYGDGKVTLVDCMKLRAQQLGKISELDGAFLQAGLDIEPGISSLGIVHYMKLRAYQLGKTNEL